MAYVEISENPGLQRFLDSISKALDQALFRDQVNLIEALAGLSERVGRVEAHMIQVGLEEGVLPLEVMKAKLERLVTMNRQVGREAYERNVALAKLGDRLGVNFNEANDS